MSNIEYDKAGIEGLIPHRNTMLLLDHVTITERGVTATGRHECKSDAFYLDGHFPGQPIMPGVMILEALAQTGAVLAADGIQKSVSDSPVFFMTIDNAKFRRPVEPGDTVELHVEVTKHRGRVWRFHGEAMVNGEVTSEADLGAMMARD